MAGKRAGELIAEFRKDLYRERLLDIYADEKVIAHQTERYIHALESYIELYGDDEVSIFSAPGRSEVGGNHTDHQRGQVLATSINLDVLAVAAGDGSDLIQVKSEGYDAVSVDLNDLEIREEEFGTSLSLIRGVAAKFREDGFRVGGFRAFMTSEVLGGSGLSSSAAFEVAVGNILSGLYNDGKADAVTIAIASQYAENRFFGKPCGLMDQMASSVGGLINIDFKDPEAPVIRQVQVDFSVYGHSLCIVDTKASHADLTDEYAAIPVEMKKIAAFFGKEVLREVEEEEVLAQIPALREACGDRAVLRALHFYADHRKVSEEVDALEKGDFEAFKKLIKSSGDSSFKYLQNVFASSMPQAQSMSIALALSERLLGEKGVCRVHGGGFAGTIQAFVPDELVEDYRKGIEAVFGEGACYVLKVRKYGGMQVL